MGVADSRVDDAAVRDAGEDQRVDPSCSLLLDRPPQLNNDRA
jgi:hypothetical protein